MSDCNVTAHLARAIAELDEAAIDSCLAEIRNTHKQLREAAAKPAPHQAHHLTNEQWADPVTMERYERLRQKWSRPRRLL